MTCSTSRGVTCSRQQTFAAFSVGEPSDVTRLYDLASVIRSKNAGPLKLTLDLMFEDETAYQLAVQSPALTPAAIAPLYRLDVSAVVVIPYRPALAVKITMDRTVISGSPGDRDVYGAQQHAPLLDIEL